MWKCIIKYFCLYLFFKGICYWIYPFRHIGKLVVLILNNMVSSLRLWSWKKSLFKIFGRRISGLKKNIFLWYFTVSRILLGMLKRRTKQKRDVSYILKSSSSSVWIMVKCLTPRNLSMRKIVRLVQQWNS